MAKNRDLSKFPNAITVLDNGNVGIAQTNPNWSYSGLNALMVSNVSIYGYTGTSGIAFNIYYNSGWKNVTTGGGGYIEIDSNSNITFSTSTTGVSAGASTSAVEKIRITGTGYLGIGTSSPIAPLHIYSSNTNMASSASTAYSNSKFRIEPYNGSSIGLSFGLISPNINYMQAVYNEGSTASMSIQPYGGNVGIGSVSPESTLVVQKATGGGRGGELSIVNNASPQVGNEAALNFGIESSTYGGNDGNFQIKAYLTSTNGATDGIFTSWTGGAFTEKMRITAAGQVQRHNQPSFLAYSTGFTATGGAWYNISNAMTTEEYDITNNYSSGRFTAPVAGRYLFFFGGYSVIASNGDRYAVSFPINGGGYPYISGGNYCIADSPLNGTSIVYNLAANDYVELSAFTAVTGQWGHPSHRVWWGGYML